MKKLWTRREILAILGLTGLTLASGIRVFSGRAAKAASSGTTTTETLPGVNILSFGAKGDGKTDDTSAFQAAIDQVKQYGGRIVVPHGVYRINGSLKDIDNVMMEGEAANKTYWSQPGYFDFDKGTVIAGNGNNVLFASGMKRGAFNNISFRDFALLANPSSPRNMTFVNCSFSKFIAILKAPGGESDSYHNFQFISCAFTAYETGALFLGRIIDSLWDQCIFVGAKAFDWMQAKSNMVVKCRFEWINRDSAVVLSGCQLLQFHDNYFDRISGNAFEIRPGNAGISIANNMFNRCGSGTDADKKDLGFKDIRKSFILLFGEFEDISICNNIFRKGLSGDYNGPLCPKYVFSKRDKINNCQFLFKNNECTNGFTDGFLYDEEQTYERIQIDTDQMFSSLSEYVVGLARVAAHDITVYNSTDVKISSIPPRLIVYNQAKVELDGKQEGTVFGGQVNGYPRYERPEVIVENYPKQSVTGVMKEEEFTIPVNDFVRGSTVYLSLGAGPDTQWKLVDNDNATMRMLLPLPTGTSNNKVYRAAIHIPAGYAKDYVKLKVSSSAPGSGTVIVDAYMVSYSEFRTRAFLDKMMK
ncbi:glycosyl hydrolase family 28-related protein [Paenibacillus elgii]